MQPSMLTSGKPDAPAVIELHGVNETMHDATRLLIWAVSKGWHHAAPNFRGAYSLGSPEAAQDVVKLADTLREMGIPHVHLVGVSGGGQAALLAALLSPESFSSVIVWVPITDLSAWWSENAEFRASVETACGGKPGSSEAVDHQYELRSPNKIAVLEAVKNLPITIFSGYGDTVVPRHHGIDLFDRLCGEVTPDSIGTYECGNKRLVIFDGGHEFRLGDTIDILLDLEGR